MALKKIGKFYFHKSQVYNIIIIKLIFSQFQKFSYLSYLKIFIFPKHFYFFKFRLSILTILMKKVIDKYKIHFLINFDKLITRNK